MAMIELIGLTKIYKGFKAVDGINLTVERGVLFGFLGPNGAGKTTTIKMMAGVLKPTGGMIRMNGLDIAREPEAVKQFVGFIPDRPFIHEKLTAREFLNFVADLYRMERGRARDEQILRLLELFELAGWADELIESYSHGMKQRLVMCSALITEPKILVVDEPMVGLDPRGARLVKTIFRGLVERGVTIFFASSRSCVGSHKIWYSGEVTSRGFFRRPGAGKQEADGETLRYLGGGLLRCFDCAISDVWRERCRTQLFSLRFLELPVLGLSPRWS